MVAFGSSMLEDGLIIESERLGGHVVCDGLRMSLGAGFQCFAKYIGETDRVFSSVAKTSARITVGGI